MKQISLIINLFLLGIIFFQACGSNKTDTPLARNEQRPDSCDRIFFSGDTGSLIGNVITYRTARSLSERYRADSGKKYIWNRQSSEDSLDATSIWFGVDILKRFIRQIETRSCIMGCPEKLGIRFYYAKYPSLDEMKNNPDFRDVNRRYADHHTLFMVPTFYDSFRGRYLDFDLRAGRCRAVFDTTRQDGLSILFALGGAGFEVENHGGVAPPPPRDGLFPTF